MLNTPSEEGWNRGSYAQVTCRPPVELNACLGNQGFWFDPGEVIGPICQTGQAVFTTNFTDSPANHTVLHWMQTVDLWGSNFPCVLGRSDSIETFVRPADQVNPVAPRYVPSRPPIFWPWEPDPYDLVPWADPMGQPLGIPMAPPAPIPPPYRYAPRRRPEPYVPGVTSAPGDPWSQQGPKALPRPGPNPSGRGNPGYNPRGDANPRGTPSPYPGAAPAPQPLPRPAGPREKERKRLGGFPGFVFGVWDTAGEAGDAIGAFYDALPPDVRFKCAAQGINNSTCIYQNYKDIDVDQALWNLLYNHLEDKAVGQFMKQGEKGGFTGGFHGFGAPKFGLGTKF